MTVKPGLRERKRERARRALSDAALALFSTRGYEQTTIADLAEAADMSPRTFFSHFASKEDVLFADPPLSLAALAGVLAAPRPEESPAALLVRGVRAVVAETDLAAEPVRVRAMLIMSTPALHVGALRRVLEGQRAITGALLQAYPGLERARASALVGAVVGALVGVITALYADPERITGFAAEHESMTDELDRLLTAALADLTAADLGEPAAP